MKIQLVHLAADEAYKAGERKAAMPPPIGLELLAACLQTSNPNWPIEVFDGNRLSDQKIFRALDGAWIGFSVWFSNYNHTIEFTRRVKEKLPHSQIVFGGPHAMNLGQRILKNNDFIDFVTVGDGEKTLVGLAAGQDRSAIPNLLWRTGKNIKFSFEQNVNLDSIPLFDLSHLYLTGDVNYDQRQFASLPVASTRGCVKGVREGRCTFCCVPTKKLRVTIPEKFWRQVLLLHKKYGVARFDESGDDFLIGDYPARILAARPPGGSKISFAVYGNPVNVTKENVAVLKKLNVKQVFLGVENVSEELLHRVNKFHTVHDSEKAIAWLGQAGIIAFPTFMFGLPGETSGTAEANYEFARTLIKRHKNITKILATVTTPIIGSKLFESMMNNRRVVADYNQAGRDLNTDDQLDFALLTKLLVKHYTAVKFDWLQKQVRKTLALVPSRYRRSYDYFKY